MKGRTTTILLFAVLLLGAFIWFVERRTENTYRQEQLVKHLFRVDAGRIDYLLFERDDRVIELERKDATWWLRRPVNARAAATEMERILTGLEDLPQGEVITREDFRRRSLSLKDYGLIRPRATLVLGGPAGRRTYAIGRDAPLGAFVYVKRDDREEVVGTSNEILALFDKDVNALRDRGLFHGPASDVQRIEVRRADTFIQADRIAGSAWRLHQPVAARADGDRLEALVSALLRARIQGFVADGVTDLTAYGLDEPVCEVSLKSRKDDQPRALRIGGGMDDNPALVYAAVAGEGSVFGVETNLLQSLAIVPDDVRDRRVVSMSAEEVGYILLKTGDEELELSKEQGAWSITRPRHAEAEAERVEALLDAWLGEIAVKFHDEPETVIETLGFAEPAWSLALARARPEPGGERPVRVVVGDLEPADGLLVVKTYPEEKHYDIPSGPVLGQSLDPLQYLKREVLSINRQDVRKITLSRLGLAFEVARDASGVFLPANPELYAVSLPGLEGLFEALASLKAVRFLEEDPAGLSVHGLDAPRATLTLGLSGEAGISNTLLIGDRNAEGFTYAKVRGQDLLFLLDPVTVDKLTQDLTVRKETAAEPSGDGA